MKLQYELTGEIRQVSYALVQRKKCSLIFFTDSSRHAHTHNPEREVQSLLLERHITYQRSQDLTNWYHRSLISMYGSGL